MAASVCIVSDRPHELAEEIRGWTARLLRDPLLTDAAKARARSADLGALVADTALRGRVLDWLSVTGFSAYLTYAPRAALRGMGAAEITHRFVVAALTQRLRKKSERIEAVHSDDEDVADALAAAVRIVRTESNRPLEAPRATGAGDRDGRPLVALARLVAQASARHLAHPADDDAAAVFEHLRTRIRFAMNAATGEVHTRDRNPLP